MRPAGFEAGQRYPVLLNIHGGPFTQYGNQVLRRVPGARRRGLRSRLLQPPRLVGLQRGMGARDPRPATGRARLGRRRLRRPDGGHWTRRSPLLDSATPTGSACSGGSYGGYMTSWIVGHTDRFKAACSERAVNNMLDRGRLERHRDLVQGLHRRRTGSRTRESTSAVALHLCPEHQHAAADPALRRRPALPGRQRRGAVRRPAHPRARGRARPVPGGGTRALPLGQAAPPRAALRDPDRLVRPLFEVIAAPAAKPLL